MLPNGLTFMYLQQMRRSGNKEENKRIIMDLDVVLKSHDCPYIVQCIGTYITPVSIHTKVMTVHILYNVLVPLLHL